jgi:peptidoglycan/LPS O-acetylase OafA/YrhL
MATDIRALTGVRGVAAAVIVAYHFGDVQLFGGGNIAYYRIPHGYLPVDLFFMLSGYVIGLTYRDAFGSGKLKNYATFMLKRVARLYPAYLAIGLLYVAKIAAGGWGLYIHPLI